MFIVTSPPDLFGLSSVQKLYLHIPVAYRTRILDRDYDFVNGG